MSVGNPARWLSTRARLPADRIVPTLLLILAGAGLPNLLPALLGVFVGLPSRATAILAYGLLAALSRSVRGWLLALAFVLVLVWDATLSVCRMFYLSLPDLAGNLHLAGRLHLFASPLYVVMIVGALATLAALAGLVAAARPALARGHRGALAAAVLAALAADVTMSASRLQDFGPLAAAGAPFQAATEQSGFAALADAPALPGRHVLLVVVESLGRLKSRAQHEALFAAFRAPALTERFTVTQGRTAFFGGTAYGELRELCHTRDSYTRMLAGDDPVCLPDRFRDQGYRTVSVHGFTHNFYDRDRWYPMVGFQRSVFQETLKRSYRLCGGAFVGPCDADLGEAIGERLGEVKEPTLFYWLTLNTHVPVSTRAQTPRFGCDQGRDPFGDREVCGMAELWADLFDVVARIAIAHPTTEILLVGDHAPPLWRRAARGLFEPGQVSWIRLTPRLTPAAVAVASPRD